MALTDKTGAAVTVRAEADRFVIAVEGHDVGLTMFEDNGEQHPEYADVVDRPTREILARLQR
jgi:hypothetical protein